MKNLIKSFDQLPYIVKLILCIPALDIVWSVYKLCRSLAKNNVLGIILGVLTIIPGATIMWLVDLVSLLLFKKVLWID